MHGDTMATINADGAIVSTHMTGPFGETLPNQTTPQNATDDTSYGYVGTHQKQTESSLAIAPIQMGARVYIPGLGRFLQVDPVEGGTPNAYVYVSDPVNNFDLNGKWGFAIPFVMSFFTAIVAIAPVIIAVAVVVIIVATTVAVVNIYNNERVRTSTASDTETISATKSPTVPTTRGKCAETGYRPAPGLPTFGQNTLKAVSSPVLNKTSIVIGSITAALLGGYKPGVILPIALKDPRCSGGSWTKYGVSGLSGNDFHYSINETECWFADIKDKSLDK